MAKSKSVRRYDFQFCCGAWRLTANERSGTRGVMTRLPERMGIERQTFPLLIIIFAKKKTLYIWNYGYTY
jgi:hypothetical protein